MDTRLFIRRRWSLLVASGAVAVAAFGAQAEIVQIAGNVGATPTYLGSPTYEWNIPGAALSSGSAVGSVFWTIAPNFGNGPAVFNWTGNALDQDLSSGGLADGTFLPGGNLSFDGEVYSGATLLHDGLLFEASVGAFHVQELVNDQNKLHLNGTILLTPTAGYFLDEGMLAPAYEMSFQAVSAEQMTPTGVGPLTDFQTDIVMITQMQFTMAAIPEPVTAMMLVLGGLIVVTRRRR